MTPGRIVIFGQYKTGTTALFHTIRNSLPGKAEVPEEHSHVVRTKGYGDWKNWFLDEDVSFFKPLLSEYLERWGYSQEWEVSENARVSPEHRSEYVTRTVLMRRSPAG